MNLYEIIDWLTWLVPLILAAGIIKGIIHFRKLFPVSRIIAIYLFAAFTTDILSRIYIYTYKDNLVFLFVFGLAELFLFGMLYIRYILQKRKFLFLVLMTAGASFILYEMYSLRSVPVEQFQSYTKPLVAFVTVLLALSFFLEQVRSAELPDRRILRLNAGVLFYASFTLVFFIPLNFFITRQTDLTFVFWLGNITCTLVFYVFLTLELWRNGINPKPLPSG
ncbi:MAG: hypothetical protein ACT6QS_14180 [Flavobacteriales bacterium]